jgi:hypothetical protein
MRRILITAIALVAGVAMVGGATLAAASASPRASRAGLERFRILSTKAAAHYQVMIATGAFTAGGRVVLYKNNGTAMLNRGTFVIERSVASTSVNASPSTCLFSEHQKGTFVLSQGTGRYRHISGSGKFLLKIEGVLGRNAQDKCGRRIDAFQQIIWMWGRVAGVR